MSAIVQYPVETCDSKNGVRRKMRGQWFVQMRGQRFCADKKQKAEKRVYSHTYCDRMTCSDERRG